MASVVVIGVAGGANSGKKTVCKMIVDQLISSDMESKEKIAVLSLDSFYRKLTPDEQMRADNGEYNFDHPESFDFDYLESVLIKLRNRQSVEVPVYNYQTRDSTTTRVQDPVDVVLLEGTLVLYHPAVRDLLSMKIFVDLDSDSRLSRRVLKNTTVFQRSLDSVLAEYTRFVKPSFEDFVLPTKKRADIVIPRGSENSVAIDIIIQFIQNLLCGGDNTVVNTQVNHPPESDIVFDAHLILPKQDSKYKSLLS